MLSFRDTREQPLRLGGKGEAPAFLRIHKEEPSPAILRLDFASPREERRNQNKQKESIRRYTLVDAPGVWHCAVVVCLVNRAGCCSEREFHPTCSRPSPSRTTCRRQYRRSACASSTLGASQAEAKRWVLGFAFHLRSSKGFAAVTGRQKMGSIVAPCRRYSSLVLHCWCLRRLITAHKIQRCPCGEREQRKEQHRHALLCRCG